MVAEIRVIDENDNWGEVLPDWAELSFSQDLLTNGVLSFQYPTAGRNAQYLTHGRQLALLLDDFEPINGRFTYFEDSGSNVPGVGGVKIFACKSNSARAANLLLAPAVGSVAADENMFAYVNKTPGDLITAALANTMSRAQAFGTPSSVVNWLTHPVPVLSSTQDSSGFPWPTTYDVTFPPGRTSLLSILEWLRDNGFAEYYMDKKTLRVLHPSRNGSDLSGGNDPVVIQTGKDLTEATVQSSSENLVNSVLVMGENNSCAWVQDAASIAKYGYREAVLEISNASQQSTLLAAGNAALSIAKNPRYAYTYAVGAKYLSDTSLKRPFVDYRVGDKVMIFDGPTPRVERIRLLSATWPNASSGSVQISVNDFFADEAEEFDKRLRKLGA